MYVLFFCLKLICKLFPYNMKYFSDMESLEPILCLTMFCRPSIVFVNGSAWAWSICRNMASKWLSRGNVHLFAHTSGHPCPAAGIMMPANVFAFISVLVLFSTGTRQTPMALRASRSPQGFGVQYKPGQYCQKF